jgi:hypothetical protein
MLFPVCVRVCTSLTTYTYITTVDLAWGPSTFLPLRFASEIRNCPTCAVTRTNRRRSSNGTKKQGQP